MSYTFAVTVLVPVAIAASLIPAALAARDSASTPTFNRDIAPIVYRNCSSCHRPGEAAPFSLLTYADVTKKGKIIAAVTASGYMPPWKAEPASYAYRDERRLTTGEIELIGKWVKAGMPEGDAHYAPAPPKFSSGWQLGEPDMTVEMPAAYHVPADGPDIYRNIAIPLGLTENKWIAAIEMRRSARSVVHHVLYFADPNGRAHLRPQQGAEPGFNGMAAGGASIPLGGWAVGAQAHFYPDGLALEVPKGSDLVIQYHFHPTGKAEAEKSVIALYFAKKPPERRMVSIQLPPVYSLFSGLDIPAGDKDYVIRDSFTLPVAVQAAGMGAHAHYLGKQLKMIATLPSGEVKTLLSIKDWDFAWQDRYFFKDRVMLPAGTRLDAEIHWDNSAQNPRNPSNPPIRVSWGEQSKDEMGSVTLIAVPNNDQDRAALEAAFNAHRRGMARERMASDPGFARKLQALLAQ
ncbi:MAG TPA: hypothetical protein VG345_07760 [Bryobacteraceae bacterium]|nr:hypothetical protein [Bryobacteraceae bacterium]